MLAAMEGCAPVATRVLKFEERVTLKGLRQDKINSFSSL